MYKIYEIETKILIEKQVFIVIYLVGTDVSARDHFKNWKIHLKLPGKQKVCYNIESIFWMCFSMSVEYKKNIKTFLIMK